MTLNVKVKRFVQARVNGGSNYDSLNRLPKNFKIKILVQRGGNYDSIIVKVCEHMTLNVKVKRFVQARVNGGSNYDSLNRLPKNFKIKILEQGGGNYDSIIVYGPFKGQCL